MSFVVDNDYQTSLLFKQFVGVAASRLDDEFSVEKFKSVPNIFSSDVMIEEIPNSAPLKISGPNNLDVSSNWLDSSCNYATGSVEESTYIGSGTDYGKTFAEIYPDTNLKFYKRLSLVPCDDVNGQGRVWGSFTDYNTNNQSVLKHTIPFKYDDVTATYLPVVRYNKIQSGNGAGTGNPNFQIGNINASPLYWVMDAGTGFLQLYNTTSSLQSAGVKDIKVSSIQDKEWAPVISCYVYNGKTGITNIDISGQQQVADISGENARLIDIERMVLPDGSANPIIDLSGNDTIRAQYEYIRRNLFIGYPAHPVITGNEVDHAFDPSHNSKYYEFDVSGSAYISNDLDVSGNIDVSNNLQVGGNTDVSGNVTIDGNIDISNNISIGGDTDISGTIIIDGGADISGNLQVGGNTDVSGNIAIDGEGDISGNLQVGGNTDVSGNITIDGEGDISGNLKVGGNTDVSGNITIDGEGDISGNLQVGGNTDVSGNITIDGEGDISGNLQVGGNTDVSGNITIDGSGDISGNLQVGGNTDVSGNITIDGEGDISGNLKVGGNTDVSGNITIDGEGDISGNLQVGGNTDVSGNIAVDGSGDISGNLQVGGNTDVSGNITIDGEGDISGNLKIGGNTDVSGNIAVDGSGDISGNLQVGGNTDVSGNITIDGEGDISGNLKIGGNTDVSGNITIDGEGDISGNLKVGGNTDISGNLTVDGILDISSGLVIGGNLDVSGNIIVDGFIDISDNLQVGGNTDVSGNITIDGEGDISGNLKVGGNTDVSGNITIDGEGDISGNLQVGGNIDVSGNITVDGEGDISGNLHVGGNTDVSGNITIDGEGDISGNLQVGGNTDISGNITIDGEGDISGNLQVGGNTDVSGNITIDGEGDISGNLQVGGNTDISGNITVDGDGDISGNLKIGENIELSGNLIIDGQIIGIDFGSGTINSGGYEVDNNGNFSIITSPAEDAARDISGIYFNDSNFDVSFSQISGNNLFVDLKVGNAEDISRNLLFFDPPKAVTNKHMDLITTTSFPRLDASWNNPTQYRVAFDFIGNNGPRTDLSAVGLDDTDDYNYLPYFQGLKIEYLLYNTSGSPVSGTSWHPVPQSNLNSKTLTGNPASYWNGAGFLPKFIKQVFIYNYTTSSSITGLSDGIVIFNDWNGSGTNFPVTDRNGYAFSLPQNCPSTSITTNGKKVQLRVAMINRAKTTIIDPSYVSHQLPSTDVSWNWVYIPDISGMAIGNYGAPTAPLTFTTPANNTFYDGFTLNGQNDNDGSDNVDSANAVVEKELFTPFSTLDANDPFFPKVRYRYDLSGHRLATSKQVGGYNTLIDISRNLPPPPTGDPSANWFPSSVNPNANPNTWTDIVNRSRNIVYPDHKYEIYGYSMRYNLDPSHNDGTFNDYRDASLNSVVSALSTWNTTYPTRNQATNTDSNGGYRDTLPNFLDPPTGLTSTTWEEITSVGWNQSNYFVAAGGIQAWNSTYTVKTNLLFLDDGVTIKAESSYNYKLRANSDNFLGIDTVGGEIIKMRSNIYLDGTTTSLGPPRDRDLSGVQTGFQAVNNSSGLGYDAGGAATNPSNPHLEWNTTDVSNVHDLGDDLREGGYYCGLEFKNPKIKGINLLTFPDVSNNSNAAGYKVVIYQELSGNSGVWTRHPTSSGGWTKIFNPALRPTADINLVLAGATRFTLQDGYDGGSTYMNISNKFKFGGTDTTNPNPTKNFFGLPILSKTSTEVIMYRVRFDNLDKNWWPTNNNLLGNFKFYVKGTGTGTAGMINWNDQAINKPWSGASSGSSGFPKLANSNTWHQIMDEFDFNGTTSSSFGGYKYSRDLMDTGYTPSNATPMFFIDGDYDNNILRANRGGSNLETGTRRTINASFPYTSGGTQYVNKILGVGPNGSYTLFWDYTFDTTKTLQNVGETGSSPYNEYPFCEIGTSPDFASQFSHSSIMTGTIANKQLVWAKDGFKHGGWSTASENPYINYTSKYWFGNHTPSALAVDYSTYQSTGETIGTTASTYSSSDVSKWYDDSSPSSFTIDTGPYKVLVVKIQKPTGFSTSQQPCCSLELKLDGTYVRWPDVTPTEAANGSKPLVWMMEDKGSTTSTFAVTAGYSQDRTGWKATHKMENTSGQSVAIMNENNMGCINTAALHPPGGSNTGVKVFDLTGAKTAGYDIYFRILIANANSSTNNLSAVRVKFYDRNGATVSSAISGTVTKDWLL